MPRRVLSDSEGSIQRASSGLREACTVHTNHFRICVLVNSTTCRGQTGTVKAVAGTTELLLVGLVGVTHTVEVEGAGGPRLLESTTVARRTVD